MSFEQFGRILLKRWGLVVACCVLVGLGAYIGSSRFVTPLYQSTVLVQVAVHSGGDPLSNDNIIASQQLAQSLADLATSDTVLSEVASHYPGLSADDLSKEVTAAPRTNTQLLEINVLDPSPTRAAGLANSIAATLIKQQLQVAQQATPTPTPLPTPTPVPTQPVLPGVPTTQPAPPKATQPAAQAPKQGNFLFVAQSARPATKPSSPNKTLYTAAGLLIGLLLGSLLAVLFEWTDPRVRTKEALAQILGWPVLTTLWHTPRREDVLNIVEYNSNIDAYDTLHTNLGFVTKDHPLHTLVVTSGTSGEGKSVVASNLAICMAKAGKSTLLIDANLRYPTLHEQFGIPVYAKGFSNALLSFRTLTTDAATYTGQPGKAVVPGELSLDPFIRPIDIPNLYVMPSGPLPPNPPELLDSKAMQRFLTALSMSGVEVSIFDAPALLGLSDASILASQVDGTLVVVDIARAEKGMLRQVKALLEQARAYVPGCVINNQRGGRQPSPYKNAPYSYDYGAKKRSNRTSVSEETMIIPTVAPLAPAISQPLPAPTPPDQKRQQQNAASADSSTPAKDGATSADSSTPAKDGAKDGATTDDQTKPFPVVKPRKTGE